MPIVKWPIPISGKLANNRPIPIIGRLSRPIIGAALVLTKPTDRQKQSEREAETHRDIDRQTQTDRQTDRQTNPAKSAQRLISKKWTAADVEMTQ